MAKQEIIAPGIGAATTESTTSEVQKLRNAIELMDSLSQSGFSEIAAIAKLALKSLETPDGYRHLDNIVHALKAIWGKADDIQNCINGEAEEVGCNYIDEDERRRMAAHHTARAIDAREAANV